MNDSPVEETIRRYIRGNDRYKKLSDMTNRENISVE
jgi:hypothetical protein